MIPAAETWTAAISSKRKDVDGTERELTPKLGMIKEVGCSYKIFLQKGKKTRFNVPKTRANSTYPATMTLIRSYIILFLR